MLISKNSFLFIKLNSVSIRVDEKINMTCGKDGGVQNLEVLGVLYVNIANEEEGRIRISLKNNDSRSLQLQVFSNNYVMILNLHNTDDRLFYFFVIRLIQILIKIYSKAIQLLVSRIHLNRFRSQRMWVFLNGDFKLRRMRKSHLQVMGL